MLAIGVPHRVCSILMAMEISTCLVGTCRCENRG